MAATGSRRKRTIKSSQAEPKATAKPTPKVPGGVDGFLKGLNKGGKKKATKKNDKPLAVIEGKAPQLLKLQQAKAQSKALEGTIKSLEGELFPDIEEQRYGFCEQQHGYVGSIKVTATGADEDGNDIDPGIASYYIQNKYKTVNWYDTSTDDELQEEYEGEATVKHEAIQAVIDVFGEDEELPYEEAEEMVDQRFEVETKLIISGGALATDKDGNPLHPEVLALLSNEALQPFLQMVSNAKPTKTFHEQAQYDPTEKAIMASLNNVGIAQRYKAVLKPSGAPRQ